MKAPLGSWLPERLPLPQAVGTPKAAHARCPGVPQRWSAQTTRLQRPVVHINKEIVREKVEGVAAGGTWRQRRSGPPKVHDGLGFGGGNAGSEEGGPSTSLGVQKWVACVVARAPLDALLAHCTLPKPCRRGRWARGSSD